MMASSKLPARHVFHSATSGPDRVQAWQEATGEPVFTWGRDGGMSGGTWFRSVKRDYTRWLEGTREAAITVYHDGMGADALGALDPCGQKVLYPHIWFPRWERNFEWMIRCTGKVMLSGQDLASRMEESFAWIPRRHIHAARPPVLRDSFTGDEGTGPARRTGIWLQGRRWKPFGNRLRSVIDRWPPDAGELEIITSGNRIPGWANKKHVRWSADLPLEFALLRLHTWDSTLLLNDYSLDAPWFLRALELGCFPLVPEGTSVARTGPWEETSAPSPYAWGEPDSAARLLLEWRSRRDELQADYDEWRRKLLHPGEDFGTSWARAKAAVIESPPPRLRERAPIGGAYPVRLYERVQRLRAGA